MPRAELDRGQASLHADKDTGARPAGTMALMAGERIERDSMGELAVPETAYYGASTERARRNFPISGPRLPRRFIRAAAQSKGAAAIVNAELGLLDARLANAILRACEEVEGGGLDQHFVVDVFQTGSGTSTNMNANEVIANRANELLGGARGAKSPVHPNDHVNLCQSSNDVIPTAIQLSALHAIHEELIPALDLLRQALSAKAKEWMPVIKTGRTHLQDATPIRLGQEFTGYAGQVERGIRRVEGAGLEFAELPLGGTAVGTGINAHPEFAGRVCRHLSRTTGVAVHETDNHFQAQATLDAVLAGAGALRTVAVSLYKIANDVRWLASGPRAGLGELALPEVQPGSSIMPGKVNPVHGEDRRLYRDQRAGRQQSGLPAQVTQPLAQHDERGQPDHGHPRHLGEHGHGARGARIDLQHLRVALLNHVLDVDQSAQLQMPRDPGGEVHDLGFPFRRQAVGRIDGEGIPGMDAGPLHVPHDAGDQYRVAVADGIHLDLGTHHVVVD